MKLLTFLGTGHYHPTTYDWNGERAETEIFTTAVARWLSPTHTIVFLTEQARNHPNWENLQRSHPQPASLKAVGIPRGESEDELWHIFELLADQVDEGEEFVIDLTHGFRSLPLVALLATAYLQQVRKARLKHLLYGAFEARDTQSGVTPVFDLSPFVAMFDWISAAGEFSRNGDARPLASLLDRIQSDAWRKQDGAPENLPRQLRALAGTLTSLSTALSLTRPAEVAARAAELEDRIEGAAADLHWAPPFKLMLDRIGQSFLPFADTSLAGQARLILWYAENGLVLQAATLIREWLIAYCCERLGRDPLSEGRPVGFALNALVAGEWLSDDDSGREVFDAMETWTDAKELSRRWSQTRDLRNDLAHCGMNAQPKTADRLTRQTIKLAESVQELART